MIKETFAAEKEMKDAYYAFLDNRSFPCIAAKAALARQQVHCMTATHMACPADDQAILQFIYDFVDVFRQSGVLYHTAAVLFAGPGTTDEESFDHFLWQRLQSLSDLDAKKFAYDPRVAPDPSSPDFSFSLKQEAFFIIGLHPGSSRPARRFQYPAIVFNPHVQFEQLRQDQKYEPIKQAVRRKDISIAGSINPMLKDYGDASEVYQYSGRPYDGAWRCPLKINHG